MNNRRHIRGLGVFLLLTYLFVNTPFILLHHHHFVKKGDPVLSFVAHKDQGEELSVFKNKCWLCDYHVVTEHKPSVFVFVPVVFEVQSDGFIFSPKHYASTPLPYHLNKGPPVRV